MADFFNQKNKDNYDQIEVTYNQEFKAFKDAKEEYNKLSKDVDATGKTNNHKLQISIQNLNIAHQNCLQFRTEMSQWLQKDIIEEQTQLSKDNKKTTNTMLAVSIITLIIAIITLVVSCITIFRSALPIINS